MLRPNKLVVDIRYRVRWQRKSHTGISIGVGKNRSIDADHLTRHIDQWSAGVAGIDGGIGLNE